MSICKNKLSGAVLPTVMVVSVLLLLSVLAVVSLWESDLMVFSRHRHDAVQRAHLESGFTLYEKYPDIDSVLLLYDSVPRSRITIAREPWGLYERVTISGYDGKPQLSKIYGKRVAGKNDIVFFYKDARAALTLTGKTYLKGRVQLPRSGVVYGQMGSVFFSGDKLDGVAITASDNELPKPTVETLAAVRELKKRGGGDITISRSRQLEDTIVVGKKVTIEKEFKGSLQVFASDSLVVESGVTLDYPSGLYCENYIEIGDYTTINGYAIVNFAGKPDVKKANYKQSRLAVVRGLVYVSGTAQLQGIVSGCVMLDKAVYYSPRGYYENMIYDATMLENNEMAWPLWLPGPPERKEIKWLN